MVGRVSNKDIRKGYDNAEGREIEYSVEADELKDSSVVDEECDWDIKKDSNNDVGEDNLTGMLKCWLKGRKMKC